MSDGDSASQVDGKAEEREGEWNGIPDPAPEIAQDEEFVDEDKYTTVTVEAMDRPGEESEDDRIPIHPQRVVNGDAKTTKKRMPSKDDKAKVKKKKFRYESKAERSATRQKQKSKNRAAMLRRKGK